MSNAVAACQVEVLAGAAVVARGSGQPGTPIRIVVPDPACGRRRTLSCTAYGSLPAMTSSIPTSGYARLASHPMRADPRLHLNGRPYFHAGVLDQGYWSDGLYTAASDEALCTTSPP